MLPFRVDDEGAVESTTWDLVKKNLPPSLQEGPIKRSSPYPAPECSLSVYATLLLKLDVIKWGKCAGDVNRRALDVLFSTPKTIDNLSTE